jgi:hypothetical protein
MDAHLVGYLNDRCRMPTGAAISQLAAAVLLDDVVAVDAPVERWLNWSRGGGKKRAHLVDGVAAASIGGDGLLLESWYPPKSSDDAP